MFTFKPSKIIGCYEIQPLVIEDSRGRFVKIFHAPEFMERGLETTFVEEYFSVSHKNVIRGLHFQLPPMDHVKMVYCQQGEALDVVADLRVGSPTYGQFELFDLSAKKANGIYIPAGLAHGFCAVSESAVMVYKVSSVYSPEHDAGVRWDSFGIPWPISEAIISIRDRNFPNFCDFVSPFQYEVNSGN
jgi:dTDP-4-dehydrorhamnose 3,5-epimerase